MISQVLDDEADAAKALTGHVEWLTGIPGTPASDARGKGNRGKGDVKGNAGKGDVKGNAGKGDVQAYVKGLGEMYVADPRFTKNYGGAEGAGFVRDALKIYAAENL